MNDLLKTAHKLIKNVTEKREGEWFVDNDKLEDLRIALNSLVALSEESGTYDWDIDVLDDRTIYIYVDFDYIDTDVNNSHFSIIMGIAQSLKITASPEAAGQSRLHFVFPSVWGVRKGE